MRWRDVAALPADYTWGGSEGLLWADDGLLLIFDSGKDGGTGSATGWASGGWAVTAPGSRSSTGNQPSGWRTWARPRRHDSWPRTHRLYPASASIARATSTLIVTKR
jgi:hypothetical protein